MSAGDMTTEAAVTKLTVLQGCCSSVAEIQQRFATPMAGTALRELQDFLTQDVFMIASCRSCAAYSIC